MITQKLSISLGSLQRTLEECAEFRRCWDDLCVVLSENVVAALYQSVVKGSVPAQTFWLKHHPPPGWDLTQSDEAESEQSRLEQMSDDELLDLARTLGLDPADPAAAGVGPAADAAEPG